jgi:hypothetical protein
MDCYGPGPDPFYFGFYRLVYNWILFRMLFHPQNPVKLPGFTLQGIFPGNQASLLKNWGNWLAMNCSPFRDPGQKDYRPGSFERLMPLDRDTCIDEFLRVKLPKQMPMIGMLIGDRTINELKAVFISRTGTFPGDHENYLGTGCKTDLNLETLVSEKIAGFSSPKLEKLVKVGHGKRAERKLVLVAAESGF